MQRKILPTIFLFGMPMGLIGTGLNAEHLIKVLAMQHDFSIGILLYGWSSLLAVIYIYLAGFFNTEHRHLLIEEWHEPFKRSFLPGVSLTLLLFLMSLQNGFSGNQLITNVLMVTTVAIAFLHLGLNLFLLTGWLFDGRVAIAHHKPTWFILLSANFVIVIALMTVFKTEITWLQELAKFYYALTLFLWLTFTTTLIYRVIFAHPIEPELRPSLFIFLAPASLGAIASMFISESYQLTGQLTVDSVNIVTWIGIGFATVMLAIWLLSFRAFIASGLSLAAWSYVYPLAAYSLALQYFAAAIDNALLLYLSIAVFIVLLAFIALLTVWLIKQVKFSISQ